MNGALLVEIEDPAVVAALLAAGHIKWDNDAGVYDVTPIGEEWLRDWMEQAA